MVFLDWNKGVVSEDQQCQLAVGDQLEKTGKARLLAFTGQIIEKDRNAIDRTL